MPSHRPGHDVVGQHGDLAEPAIDGAGRKSRRTARGSRQVGDGALGDRAAEHGRSREDLGVDEGTGGAHRDVIEEGTRVDLECAVDIAEVHVEQRVGERGPAFARDHSRPWVAARSAVAGDDVRGRFGAKKIDEAGKFVELELLIAIGIKDPWHASGGEAGAEGGTVAEIARVADVPDGGVAIGESLRDAGCVVGGAVVDDEDFEIVLGAVISVCSELPPNRERGVDHEFEVARLIPAREEDREAERVERRSVKRWATEHGGRYRASERGTTRRSGQTRESGVEALWCSPAWDSPSGESPTVLGVATIMLTRGFVRGSTAAPRAMRS